MVKRGGTNGSGAYTWISGWINILFPYLAPKGEVVANPWCEPYDPGMAYVLEGRNGGKYIFEPGEDVRSVTLRSLLKLAIVTPNR